MPLFSRFLWNLYCNDSGTYILKSDFTKALNLLPYENASLFAQTDRINFEQFQAWLLKNRTSTVLSKWLLSDNCISLTSELETPTFYQSLAGVTHLEEKVNNPQPSKKNMLCYLHFYNAHDIPRI